MIEVLIFLAGVVIGLIIKGGISIPIQFRIGGSNNTQTMWAQKEGCSNEKCRL